MIVSTARFWKRHYVKIKLGLSEWKGISCTLFLTIYIHKYWK